MCDGVEAAVEGCQVQTVQVGDSLSFPEMPRYLMLANHLPPLPVESDSEKCLLEAVPYS